MPLILSLFPGIGLLDMAFEQEGFCIVRGPDVLWGGDIKTFFPPAGKFDGVIGGPPCQAFSRPRHLVEHNGYVIAENLIPEFSRVVEAARPDWFLMENVPGAPDPLLPMYDVERFAFNNRWTGADQNRMRWFWWGSWHGRPLGRVSKYIELAALESATVEPAVCASGGAAPVPVRIGGSGKVKRSFTARHVAIRKSASAMGYKTIGYLRDACRLQGLPADFLDHAPFTVAGKIKCVGNGVPLPMGYAIVQAVKRAISCR